MIAMTQQTSLLIMWITFSVLALSGVIAVFVWAVRTRQFANQQAARYLALKAGIPEDNDKLTTEHTKSTEKEKS